MNARHIFSLSVAGCALAAAAPALAQPEMTYDQGTYQYATPAPNGGPVIYRQEPVVQPIPAPAPQASYPVIQNVPAEYDEYAEMDEYGEEIDDIEYDQRTVQQHEYQTAYPAPRTQPYHGQPYHTRQVSTYPAAGYPYPEAMPRDFDRAQWLADCREGYRNPRRNEGATVGGGLLGAAIGGVIGNRVADGERLAGTLIGAGVGGLAGLVIGSAIANSGERRRAREACEAWLDEHMANAYRGPASYAQGYPTGYGYASYGYPVQMTYVPVLVAVPQRAVIRETVTEEWVDVPTYREESVSTKKRVMYRKAPAPKPIKRTKYSKNR